MASLARASYLRRITDCARHPANAKRPLQSCGRRTEVVAGGRQPVGGQRELGGAGGGAGPVRRGRIQLRKHAQLPSLP